MKLTTRERQLLDAAANGQTDRQISDDLNISIETVSSYWRGVRLKFQANSRTECVARYSQQKSQYLVVKHELESSELQREIKDRTEAQAEVVAQRNMLAAITDASLAYITGRSSLTQCLTNLLEDVLNLTHSEFGIIGEIQYENNQPILQEHALTHIDWSEQQRRLVTGSDSRREEFGNLNSLFGAVMAQKEAVILNDTSNVRMAHGIPDGPLVWKTFLGIPVFSGTQLIGMIGLANRDGGYSYEILDYLKPLIASCATFIIGYRLEIDRRAMQQRIADSEALSREIIALAPTGVLYEAADGTIQIVNLAFLSMFGIFGTPDEFVGCPFEDINRGLMGQFLDPEATMQRFEELRRVGEAVAGEILEFADKRRFRREFLVMKSQGVVRGYLWRYRDITRKTHTRVIDFLEDTETGSHI